MALTPRFDRTPHLVELVGEAEHLATLLSTADPGAAAAELWADAALASLRLDGSTIPRPPSRDEIAAALDAPSPHVMGVTRTGWGDTLRSATDVEKAKDTVLWAREFQGVVDAMTADDLAARLRREPVDALAELHRRLTHGLVARDLAGVPRRSEQAVHDAATGRIVFFTADPAIVPAELHRLGGWLASAAAREHGLIVSGIAHFELLRIHPFESANGRLARAAGRLLLRSRGLDPHGLAVAEIALADDPLGTYEEVARTQRRRDLTIWLERWGEAVTAGLRIAANRLGVLLHDVPERFESFAADRTPPTFTVVDYRAEAGVEPEQARADLAAALDAGRIERILGARGLRFRITG